MFEIAMLQANLISHLPGLTIKGNVYAKTTLDILSSGARNNQLMKLAEDFVGMPNPELRR
jgi:hypothetical protein